MTSHHLRVERPSDGVALLVLDNPDQRNAMSDAMTEAWAAAVADLAGDPTVRAVVVTGEGSAFCSGGDTSWIASEPDATVDDLRRRMLPFYRAWLGIRSLEVPTIAAVNGAAMRVAVLLFLGCLGLLIRAHEMTSDLAGLAGFAISLYGLSLALRRPVLGGVAAGIGMGVAFLGDGFLPLAMLALLVAVLPAVAPAWRSRAYGLTAVAAFACAAPLVAAYPMMLGAKAPIWLQFWINAQSLARWSDPLSRASLADLVYFAKIVPWYAWPAWPLAAWSVWRSRRMLATRKAIQLPLAAFAVFLVVLSLFGEAREVNAMPMLLPLALLGVAELDSVPRGGASALDWFGVTTFFLLAALIWIGWIAVMTGRPEGVLGWIRNEVPGFTYQFSFLAFALASLLTLIWLVVAARSLRSTRRALVNWTAGITMVWMLVMTLGVPLVDQARSYRAVSSKLVTALPANFRCIASKNLGDAQRALLDYFIGLRAIRIEAPAARRCNALLVQAVTEREPPAPEGWRERWRGSRPGDRHEVFILYERS